MNTQWKTIENPSTDFPSYEDFRLDPRMYLVISKTGRVVAAEPLFDPDGTDRFHSWWVPTGSIHVMPEETIAYAPLEIPQAIMDELEVRGNYKRSRLYKLLNPGR